MFAFIFKSNLRLIARNKFISTVKILGMASGVAIVLLTAQFCLRELSYDTQHPNYDRIFRYVHSVSTPEGIQSFAFTSATTGPALKERYPEVETFCRVFRPANVSVQNITSDNSFNERRFAFADSNFFQVFNFPLINNHDTNILHEPFTVVLTPSSAKKYFGDDDPVGKSMLINGVLEFVVKGVLRENFSNSHFNFDFVASFSSLQAIANHPIVSKQIPATQNLEHKGYNTFYTYLLLSHAHNAQTLEAKFPAFIEEFRGTGRSERLKPYLQSLASIHLNSDLLYEIDQNGSLQTVYVYLFIGMITLLISCINYINISTAEFLKRAKGVGLKKILGIDRSHLIWGHFFETTMLGALSLVIGYCLAILLLPVFENIVNRQLDLFSTTSVTLMIVIFLFIIVVSGIYPAFRISQASAMQAFKGELKSKPTRLNLRNALVAFQLLVSFCLITLSLLIFYQLDYLITRDLGFDAEQVMVVNATSVEPKQRITFKNNFISNRNITSIGMCSTPPGESLFTYGITFSENEADEERRLTVYQSFVDGDYLEALGLKVGEGRFFSSLHETDSNSHVVINETAMRIMGDSAFSKRLKYLNAFRNVQADKSIVGVIHDFNFASLHQEIQPLMLEYDPDYCGYYLVRFNANNVKDVINDLQAVWKDSFPMAPFDYYFLDDRFQMLYDNDQRQKSLITLIAVIAIFLAALGIFGTTLFMVEQRSKEIGIRKMLGSERSQLLMLLIKPTFFLVVASCVVGIPFAISFGNRWLSQYPNRVEFSPLLFVMAFFLIAIIMISTITYHCLKLTRINPTEVLRKIS